MTQVIVRALSRFKKLSLDSAVGVGGQFLIKGIRFLTRFILARYLGPAAYGLFSLGFEVTNLLRVGGQIGHHRAAVKYIPERDGKSLGETLFIVLTVPFLSSCILGGSLYIFADPISTVIFDSPDLEFVFKAFGAVLPFWVMVIVTGSVIRSFKRVGLRQVLVGSRELLLLGVVLLAVAFSTTLYSVLLGILISSVLAAIFGLLILHHASPVAPRRPRKELVLKSYQIGEFAVPTMLMSFTFILLTRVDQLFVGAFQDSAAVGVYNVAVLLSSQLSVIFTGVKLAFEPNISELYTADKHEQLTRQVRAVTRWLVIVSYPLAGGLILFAPELLDLFGRGYESARIVLYILVIHHLFYISVGPTGELLQLTGYEMLVLKIMSGMLVLNIILNGLLIPQYGLEGAAIATVAALTLARATVLAQVQKRLHIMPVTRRSLSAILFGILFIGAAYLLAGSQSMVTKIGVAVLLSVCYGISAWVYSFTTNDRCEIRSIFDSH